MPLVQRAPDDMQYAVYTQRFDGYHLLTVTS